MGNNQTSTNTITGLSQPEAENRLKEYGYNKVVEKIHL
jgi:magnesium-transporting ATPase (P-type)